MRTNFTVRLATVFMLCVQLAQPALAQSPGGVNTNLKLWLKADAGTNTTTDGASVTSWNDQSGSARNAGNANAVTYRSGSNSTYAINFNPAVDFTASNSRMYNITGGLASTSSASLHLFLITNVRSGTSSEKMFSGFTNLGASFTNNWADIPAFRATGAFYIDASAGGGAGTLASYSPSIIGNDAMLSLSINPGTSTVQIRQNGLQTVNTTGVSLQSGTQGYVLGNDIFGGGGNNNSALFTAAEAIAYEGQLTGTTLTRVESYLALKYGITLGSTASSVSYLASDGTTTWTGSSTYQNNVAGIGRDDQAGLNQKQSSSANSTTSQVVMALGTAAASNGANANTFSADKQFFIWGDDNGSLTTQVSTGNNTYTYRFSRIWKTQNTGSFAQAITVYFPVSAFGNAQASGVSLIYGSSTASLSNGTASTIAQSGTTSINGVSHYIFTVPAGQIANMQFFSFTGTISSPGGVTGESLWLKSDAGTSTTTDGGNITSWADQSGNGNNATTAVHSGFSAHTSAGATYRSGSSSTAINFNPVVDFAGNKSMDGNAGLSTRQVFAAIKRMSSIQAYAIGYANSSGSSGGGAQATLRTGTTGLLSHWAMSGPNSYINFVSSIASPIGTTLIGDAQHISNASGNVLVNGIGSTTINTSLTPPSPYTGAYRLGAASDDQYFSDGPVPEVISYNTNLTTTQRTQVQSYLAIKYGVTLGTTAATVSYLSSDGTTTWTGSGTYQNNIAGIGRDDLTGLYQKQSQSVNTGSQVVMALGTAAASNQTNTNTFSSDKQFFIWGDDNGSLTTQVGTGNSTYTYRFTCIWKTQNTGSFAQGITVYYPVSAFGNAQASGVSLLYGTSAASLSNGTATAIAQSGTTTINGASYYVFTVPSGQIANMQFFSFTGTISSPGGVTGESLWLRSDAGTSTTVDGTNLSSWLDQSGQGNDAAQATGINQPVYRSTSTGLVNFNPSIYFDGNTTSDASRDWLDITSPSNNLNTASSNYNIFSSYSTQSIGQDIVCYISDGTGVKYDGYGDANTGGVLEFHLGTNTSNPDAFLQDRTAVGNTSISTYTHAIGIPFIQRGVYLNASVGVSVNGSAETSTATTRVNKTASNYRIGGHTNGSGSYGRFFYGNLTDVIAYKSDLSAANKNRIESYLAIKNGLTLDQTTAQNYTASDGTTVTWNATTNSSYKNNIAGIGRDDLTALNQKQSQSIYTSTSQVIMALGTAAASNQANANTFASDKQFFIWGDDNGSLTTQVSTGNSTYTYRFTRIWKTQNTGSFAQGITVYYPVSAFGNALAATVSLLYGTSATSLNNGTATAIVQSGTTTINSVSYYAFTVPSGQIANMQFFSFTGTQTAPGGVNGMVLWLRADKDLTPSSGTGTVTAWLDQSGLGNDIATIAGTPSRSNVLLNFNPSIDFNADDEGMSGTDLGMGADATWGMFNVFAPNEFADGADILCVHTLAAAVDKVEYTTTGGVYKFSGVTSFNTPSGLISLSKPNVLSTISIAAGTTQQFLDGLAGSSAAHTLTSSTNPYVIGDETTGGTDDGLSMNFGESVMYDKLLTATERNRIQSYLALKYGVTLGNTSNLVNYLASDGTTTTWTASATYQNNIAGIGRDDLTALYQKQSQSVNSGSQMIMALGTAAATNQANANTISSDKQFLIWGDNNGSVTSATALSGFGAPSIRLLRVWALQNTNSFNQQVTVYYPTAVLDAALGLGSKYFVYDNASGFNGTAQTAIAASGTTNINGIDYTAFTVTFPITGTLYFSFGAVKASPVLTVGSAVCDGTGTYSVSFISNGTVTSSGGTVSGNTVTGIPVGTNVTLTATATGGGITTAVVTSPTSCPTINGCTPPALTAGQGVCSGGGVYNVVFNASAGATITASAGTVSGNTVTGIAVGTNVTITATLAAGCSSAVTVNSPADCSTPCATPSAAFTAGTCSGSTYTVYFTKTSTSVITASTGTVTGGGAGSTSGTISGIATGTAVTATVTESGCSTQLTTISAPSTTAPTLTAGDAVCSGTGTYSVIFSSNGIVTASAGTISGNSITGIPTGTNVTITATSTNGCATTTAVVTSPASCPTINGCTPPALTAGQGVCSGGGVYSVVFSASAGATVTASAGTVSGNTVTGIAVGTNVTITATLAAGCSSAVTVNSPADCSTPCATPSAAFTAGTCSGSTYTVYFTKTSTSVITASAGTVTGGGAGSTSGTISGIATGTSVTATVTESGCSTQIFTIDAPSTTAPILTTGSAVCSGTGTYSVTFSSNGIVTASAGTISGNSITGIPTGTNVIITATSTNGCATTTAVVTSPTSCPAINGCTPPSVTAGQGVCSGGGVYSVVFNASAGATVTASAGTVSGNTVTGIAVGTNVTITATLAAGCSSGVTVNSPADCSTPCATPSAAFTAGTCSGSTYAVYFTKTSTSVVTASAGTVTGGGAGSTSGTISGIATGTTVTATVTESGCSTQITTISAPSTTAPTLTAGDAVCSGTGTYSVIFSSNGIVTASAGTVNGNTITGIPTGTNVIITATSTNGCATTTAVVISPTSCPTINGCTPPSVTAGQGVCSGGGVYSVVFSASAGATVTASAGTVSGNTVTGIAVGTNVTITATLGAGCSSAVTVNSPADCSTPCATPSAAFTAGTCSGSTYTVYFTKTSTSAITASTGTVTGGGAGSTSGTISGIATGTAVTATVTESGCSTQITTISAPSTTAPTLTAGSAVCSGTGTYSVTFSSNGIVTASAGTVNGNTITGIPTGTNVTITSTSTNGCATTTAVVTSPTSCPTTNGCTPPSVTAGQGVCSGGGNYSVVFSASAGATVTASAGTVSGNTVTGIPVGTNVTITATLAAGCSSAVTVNSPADCSTPCATPSAAFTAGTCSGSTYTVYFTKTSTSVITASTGTVTGGGAGSTSGTISGIATGTAVTATVTESGCSTQLFTIDAPSMSAPILSVGGAVCSGTGTYSVVFNSSGIVTASAGTISGNTVTGIPTGTDVIITATSVNSCAVTQATVISPVVCPAPNTCTPPALTAGNGVCNGTGTYSVAFSADPGAVISVSAGTVSGNSIINIPVGTHVQITATAAAGGCSTVLTVNSPADCSTSCVTPSASFSNAVSSGTTYSVYFSKSSTSAVTASAGTVTGGGAGSTGGTITGIPVGTNITVTVTEAGCSTNYYGISSPAVGVVVNVKALLQGAMSGSTMTTTLRNLNVIPLVQPYSGAPWNYAGTESVTSIPANVTDWVLVELRDAAIPGTVLATRAAFVKSDGSVVDLDGVSPVSFPVIGEGSYYIAVRHRNHLGIRTAAAQYLKGSSVLYDFTTSQSAAYQNTSITTNTAMKDMGGGIYAMWAGNVNASANVRYSGLQNDLAALLSILGGSQSTILNNVYSNGDINMNGVVRYSGLNNDNAFLLSILGGNQASIFTQHQ